ncbi:MAG: hypothetical protein ACMXX5_01220 [Candidatus Woesearchaeota archaeon]
MKKKESKSKLNNFKKKDVKNSKKDSASKKKESKKIINNKGSLIKKFNKNTSKKNKANKNNIDKENINNINKSNFNKDINKNNNRLNSNKNNSNISSANAGLSSRKTYSEILCELEEIKEKESELLKKINYDIRKDEIKKKKIFRDVERFSFNDFAQIMIGCCVFGLPAFINTSFWEYLPAVRTDLLFYIHLFFILCVLLALNYEFRDNFNVDLWFFKMLMKRFFYTYFSVLMIILLLLGLVNKMSYSLPNILILRHFLAAQSVGVFGAITFSFLKK